MAKNKKAKDLETIKARFITHHGFRNSSLEDLHSGKHPLSKTGDYSDVKVVTPYGEISWKEVSRISNEEMRDLMLDVEKHMKNALKVFEMIQTKFDTPIEFQEIMTETLFDVGVSWDMNFEEIERRLERIKPIRNEESNK